MLSTGTHSFLSRTQKGAKKLFELFCRVELQFQMPALVLLSWGLRKKVNNGMCLS